jgi:hypothetical protein
MLMQSTLASDLRLTKPVSKGMDSELRQQDHDMSHGKVNAVLRDTYILTPLFQKALACAVGLRSDCKNRDQWRRDRRARRVVDRV